MTAPIRKASSDQRPLLRTPDRRTTGRDGGRAVRRAASGVQPHLGGATTALIAEGTLGSRPLVFLVRDLLDREIEGTLNLVDDRGHRHGIHLSAGVPVALQSEVTTEPLATTLHRLGLVSVDQRKRLGRFSTSEDELARHLVEQRLVSPKQLDGALRHRLMLKLERLLSLGEQTRFSLRRAAVTVDDARPCNVLALLMRGFRRLAHTERAAMVLEHLGDRELTLHAHADFRFLGLTRTEREIVDGLDAAAATLDELFELGLGPPPVVRAAVYALAELRFLDLGRTAPPVAVPSEEHLMAGRSSDPARPPIERAHLAHLRPEVALGCSPSRPFATHVATLGESSPDSVKEPDVDALFARAEIAFAVGRSTRRRACWCGSARWLGTISTRALCWRGCAPIASRHRAFELGRRA